MTKSCLFVFYDACSARGKIIKLVKLAAYVSAADISGEGRKA